MRQLYDKKLSSEIANLVKTVEQLGRERDQQESRNNQLREELQTQGETLRQLHIDHITVMDVLRLLTVATVDRHVMLGRLRNAVVGDTLATAAETNASEQERATVQLRVERDRYRIAYRILLENWHYLPKDERPEISQRLLRVDLRQELKYEDDLLEVKKGTISQVAEAFYGGQLEDGKVKWVDVTEVIKSLVIDGGIPSFRVNDTVLGVYQSEGKETPAKAKETGDLDLKKRLVISYIPKKKSQQIEQKWRLARSEQEMASDALHSLAQLMEKWGISIAELLEEFGVNAESDGKLTWDKFLEVFRDLTGEIGTEETLKKTFGIGDSKKALDLEVFRSRLDAHYWYLIATGLRKYVGSTSVVSLAQGNLLASRRTASDQAHGGVALPSSTNIKIPPKPEMGVDWSGSSAELELRCQEAESRITMQMLYIESLQVSLGFERTLSLAR
mmetsp:Transcript_10621/g.16641  ORF Transcript_10621/g.16641 Transcript_10621/m.16641 type:complete len:446 (-) Transcript_10621:1405-2742(-)